MASDVQVFRLVWHETISNHKDACTVSLSQIAERSVNRAGSYCTMQVCQTGSRIDFSAFESKQAKSLTELDTLCMEHAALDSRVEELLNDPTADEDDVILFLGQEFNVEGKR